MILKKNQCFLVLKKLEKSLSSERNNPNAPEYIQNLENLRKKSQLLTCF